METKKCKTCNRELPLEAFRKDKHGYLGRKANCKECHDEFHHIYGYGNNTEQQFNEWNNKEVI